MLDVGFSEILLTSAIALIVLGPERLPKVARQVGNWMGRARSMARQLTEQLEREVDAEDLLRETKKKANATDLATRSTTSPAPAAFDTSAMSGAAGSEPVPGVYDPGVTPQGADWQPAPTETKPHNG
jgi:sec-independent protein translocase protein TatB